MIPRSPRGRRLLPLLGILTFAFSPTSTLSAADGSAINSGDTAWMLTSTALVLFMMIPGLALFYAGLVKAKNVLSLFMQCFALTCVLSLVWLVCGYSLAFSDGNAFIGGFSKVFLSGLTPETAPRSDAPSIPPLLHFAYQMMFFLITPGLFVGAFAERMKFSAILVFSIAWSLLVYVPCCYGVWHKAGAFFGLTGVIDLAGGIVVHITAGVAALVACIVVGPRSGHPTTPFLPHNLPFTVAGAAMLWVGWFGFNAGSQLAANGYAAMTLVVTHLSACAASVVWMLIEWIRNGKPSVLGIATGSIAGLAAITPASGKVGPIGALVIGSVSAILCWAACAKLKQRFKYDDSLDVFGVHGVGGFVGTVLVAVFGSKSFAGGLGDFEIMPQLKTQVLAALYTIILSGAISFVLLKIIGATIGLRVTTTQENEGLDLADHGESAYNN
jgi:Amt family ammonium transporter